MGKRRSITAEELMRQLEADPKWVADRAERDARHAERVAKTKADHAPIVSELIAAGVTEASISDILNCRPAPPEAIPVLVRHMNMAHLPNVRETVIRPLGVPWARAEAFEPLCAAFRVERDPNMRFVIANALSGMAQLSELSELQGIDDFAALFAER